MFPVPGSRLKGGCSQNRLPHKIIPQSLTPMATGPDGGTLHFQ